jgi:hypothetical protein
VAERSGVGGGQNCKLARVPPPSCSRRGKGPQGRLGSEQA